MPGIRSSLSVKARLLLLIVLIMTALSIVPVGPVASQGNGTPHKPTSNPGLNHPPRSVSEMINQAQATGKGVRVLVRLNTTFQPTGHLNLPAAAAQNARINQSRAALVQSLAPFGASVVARSNQWKIPFVALKVNAAALRFLANSPQVISITEDKLSTSSNNSSSLQNEGVWNGVTWAGGYDGTGTTVAIVDTGVESSHSFISPKVIAEYCSSFEGTYNDNTGDYVTHSLCPHGVSEATGAGAADPHICDDPPLSMPPGQCEHGTHVAGIAAGNDGNNITINDGVARGATIIAAQVFTDFVGYCPGDCALSFDSDQINALNYIDSLSINAGGSFNITSVNMSLGFGFYDDEALCDSENAPMKAAIDQLRSHNIATVIASGNDFLDDGITYPGCISSAVAVGSISDSELKISYFTNISPLVELLASGENINSSVPNNAFADFSGTSMATPQVTGAWAVIRQAFPLASVTDILQALQQTGTPIMDDIRSGGFPVCFDHSSNIIPCSNATYKLINVAAAIDFMTATTPTLLNPADGAIITTTSVTLSWSALPYATGYELQMDTVDPPVAAPISLTGTSYVVPGLAPGDRYYWRVRAQKWGSVTDYSGVRHFNVDEAPRRNYFTTDTPTLTWSRVTGAAAYEIQVASNKTFTPVLQSQIVSGTTVSYLTAHLDDGNYYFRVRACASLTTCAGSWSAAEEFQVDAIPGPP